MAKQAELVQRLNKPINRADHKGYFVYLYGNELGVIDGVYRSPIKSNKKKAE